MKYKDAVSGVFKKTTTHFRDNGGEIFAFHHEHLQKT